MAWRSRNFTPTLASGSLWLSTPSSPLRLFFSPRSKAWHGKYPMVIGAKSLYRHTFLNLVALSSV
jgi:hypothetical protein